MNGRDYKIAWKRAFLLRLESTPAFELDVLAEMAFSHRDDPSFPAMQAIDYLAQTEGVRIEFEQWILDMTNELSDRSDVLPDRYKCARVDLAWQAWKKSRGSMKCGHEIAEEVAEDTTADF